MGKIYIFEALITFTALISISDCQLFGRRREASCDKLNGKGNGKEFQLDRESNKCFEIGTQGPCGEMMIFYDNPSKSRNTGPKYGFCDCDQGFKSEYVCKDSPIRKRVYIHKDRRCYSVFSQGPCKTGEWLILSDENDSPTCVPNRCLKDENSRPTSNQFWFYEPKRRACYQSETRGYCPVGLFLELVHDSQYPKCKNKECYGSLTHGIRSSLKCRPGSRFSYLTNSCARTFRNYLGVIG